MIHKFKLLHSSNKDRSAPFRLVSCNSFFFGPSIKRHVLLSPLLESTLSVFHTSRLQMGCALTTQVKALARTFHCHFVHIYTTSSAYHSCKRSFQSELTYNPPKWHLHPPSSNNLPQFPASFKSNIRPSHHECSYLAPYPGQLEPASWLRASL